MDPQTGNWQDCLEYAALTDVGLRRANNQDSMSVAIAPGNDAWQRRGHVFMVADGMGAHAAGELASKLATDTVPLAYHKLLERAPPDALVAAVQEANDKIHARGQASLDFKGMGTTATVLVLVPQGAMVAHVGDSRAYRLRANRFEQLTFDHSLVWEMRAAANLAADQVPDNIPKNVITRSLGPNPSVQIDLEGPFPVRVGDTFLVCCDGLSGPVKDEEMGMIASCLPPAEAVRALVDLANLRGGPDNITVLVAKVTGPKMVTGAAANPAAETPAATRPVHPALWVLLGVFALIGLGLLAMEWWLLALLSLLVAGGAGVMAFLQRYGGDERPQFDGRPRGRGPYTATDCTPSAELVARLADIVRDLREAAMREDYVLDWSRFNGCIDRAAAASQAKDYSQAVRQYCEAMSFMMAELKRQKSGTRSTAG